MCTPVTGGLVTPDKVAGYEFVGSPKDKLLVLQAHDGKMLLVILEVDIWKHPGSGVVPHQADGGIFGVRMSLEGLAKSVERQQRNTVRHSGYCHRVAEGVYECWVLAVFIGALTHNYSHVGYEASG